MITFTITVKDEEAKRRKEKEEPGSNNNSQKQDNQAKNNTPNCWLLESGLYKTNGQKLEYREEQSY